MTQEQRNLIIQAIGALKAALGSVQIELQVEQTRVATKQDWYRIHKKNRELAKKLFEKYGYKDIPLSDRQVRLMAFDAGISRMEHFLPILERRQMLMISRRVQGSRSYMTHFRFTKAMQ